MTVCQGKSTESTMDSGRKSHFKDLCTYVHVTENCGVPLSNSEEFWQNCAIHLSEVHGCLRTGMFRIN